MTTPTLEQMAERLAGSASSPREFLMRSGSALHYLNAAYRMGIEDAAKILDGHASEFRRYFQLHEARSVHDAAIAIRALAPKAEDKP
jgi:hypothetical protein